MLMDKLKGSKVFSVALTIYTYNTPRGRQTYEHLVDQAETLLRRQQTEVSRGRQVKDMEQRNHRKGADQPFVGMS